MTRTGVLSLLIAAYAVTNTHQAYASSIESNPRFLQDGRSMQAYLYSFPSVDLTEMGDTNMQIFNQFIDSTAMRLEGHITTDRIYYIASDAVFVDLLIIDALAKTPYMNPAKAKNITVNVLDNTGALVSGLSITNLFTQGGPAHGFQFVLPNSISAGEYLIVATYPDMATATRTFVVQNIPNPPPGPNDVPPMYTATFNFFDQTYPSTGILHGNMQVAASNGNPVTARTTFQIGAYNVGTNTPFVFVTVDLESTGIVYFSLDFTGAGLVDTDSVTIQATGQLPDQTSPTYALIPQTFQQPITIGAAIQGLTLINFQDFTGPDYNYFGITFFTEAGTDLVPDVYNYVYFSAWIQSPSMQQPIPVDFSNANLYAYDPNLPARDTILVQSSVGTVRNGYGVLSEFKYDNSMIYYIEYQPDGFIPNPVSSYISVDPTTQPQYEDENVVLEDGTFRIPIFVNGIQSILSTIKEIIFLKNPVQTNFASFVLSEYTFTSSTPQTLTTTAGSNAQSNQFTFGYSNGYFFVTPNYTLTDGQTVRFPPLLVFNNFPRPTDFSNLLLNYTNGHLQGLVTDSSQSTTVSYPITGSSATNQFTFVAQDLSYQFYTLLIADLSQIEVLNAELTALGLDSTPTPDKINKLAAIFSQVPYAPQTDSQYFGKYGPIDEQYPIPALQTLPLILEDSGISQPTINMHIDSKVLDNGDDLEIRFSTNEDFDTTEIYVVQIKHKEQIIHQQVVNLKPRLQKERYLIDGSQFDLPNGAILQVNLYRVTQDYEDFLTNLNSRTFCNLQTLINSYPSMSEDDQNKIAYAEDVDVLPLEIADALTDLEITVPGTTCILVSADLTSRFLEPIGSISIFLLPVNAYEVRLSTSCTTSCIQGQSVTVTMQLFNLMTQTYLTSAENTANPHFATLIVSEDIEDPISQFYETSLPGKVYLEYNVNYEQFGNFDAVSQVDQYFSSADLANSTDDNLDILLTLNNLRNSVFESKLYQILDSKQDYDGVFTQAIPNTYEKLSDLFGYNFELNPQEGDPVFVESDIRNYIHSQEIQANIVYLQGVENLPYRRNAPANSVYSSLTTGILSSFALTLGAGYKSLNEQMVAETLYFKNNIAFTGSDANGNAQATITFPIGDLATNFKVSASSYGSDGFGAGETVFTVGPAFEVDFDLPERIAVGDTINITATISNADGLSMTVVPSLVSDSSPHFSNIVADFSHVEYSMSGNTISQTTMSSYPLTANTLTKLAPFQLTTKALMATPAVVLTFTFTATLSNQTTSQVTVMKTINIVNVVQEQDFFQSGLLQTADFYETDMFDFDHEADITITLPDANNIPSVYGQIILYPTTQSQLVGQVRYILSTNTIISPLESVLSRLLVLNQFIDLFTTDSTFKVTANYPDIESMVQEASNYMNNLFTLVQDYQVWSEDGETMLGFDNFQNSMVSEGDSVITSYATMTLSTILPNLNTTNLSNVKDLIDQNVEWILLKFNNDTLTSQNNVVNSQPDESITVPFITMNLYQTTVTNTTVQAQLLSALSLFQSELITSLASEELYEIQHVYHEELYTNPYAISLEILALGATSALITSNSAAIANLQMQLLRYVEDNGQVTIPMGVSSLGNDFYERADATTIFGGIGNDRNVEYAAMAGLALAVNVHTSEIFTVLKRIGWYLQSLNYNGFYGNFRTSYVANSLVQKLQNPLFIDTQYQVLIYVNDNKTPYAIVDVNGDYLPITVNFNATTLGLTSEDAYTDITFNIDPFNVQNPVQSTIWLNETLGTTTLGSIDSVIGYSFFMGFNNPDFSSNMTYRDGLTFTVTPLNESGLLGSPEALGEMFQYKITLLNQLDVNQGLLYVMISPPACLDFDPTQFNALLGGNYYNLVQYWFQDLVNHQYTIAIRGLEASGVDNQDQIDIVVSGTQVSTGVCQARPYVTYPYNAYDINLLATPVV